MDEEQAAYQSEQESYEAPETSIETGDDVTETPVTTQEEYDIIKYNKEEVKIPVSERQNYLQKGYNYDKVQQKASELEGQVKYLEKRARQEGFADVQSYLTAIDELEQQQQIEQEAARMRMDPDTYAQYFHPVTQRLTEAEMKLQAYEQEREQQTQQQEINTKWGALYNEFPGLMDSAKAFVEGGQPEWYNDSMKGYVSRGYDPVDAYRLAHSDTITRQKEQEVLARVTGRDVRQVLPSTDSPNNIQFDPEDMTSEQRQAISERVRRGEQITF